MENIGKSGVSGNQIASKYTYLGNSPEFRVVLEPWERILTDLSLTHLHHPPYSLLVFRSPEISTLSRIRKSGIPEGFHREQGNTLSLPR